MKSTAFAFALAAAVVLLALLSAPVPADVPQLLHYQGVLTDGAGVAVADGDYQITFRIYDVAAGGSPLWTETNTVHAAKGIFDATLGAISMLGVLPFDRAYYIGLSIGGGEELPRQILAATPFAFTARGTLGESNTFPSWGNVGVGTTEPSSPLSVRYDNLATVPAITIENNAGAGAQDLIDFRFDGSTQARFRKARNGNLFIGSLGGYGMHLQTGDANRLTILGTGRIGVGTDSPAELLDVAGGVRVGNSTNTNPGAIRWTGTDFEGYTGLQWESFTEMGAGVLPPASYGQTLFYNGAEWEVTGNLTNDGSNVGIGTTGPGYLLEVAGDVFAQDTMFATFGKFGSAARWGTVRIDGPGGAMIHGAVNTSGGILYLYDEAGAHTMTLQGDASAGGGGSVSIYRNASNAGISLEGNYGGNEAPRVTISGPARTISFRTDQERDLSVNLPADAIASDEMLDEPGLANYTRTTAEALAYNVVEKLAFRSIAVPAAGYVVALAQCSPTIDHVSGTGDQATFAVSTDTTSYSDNQAVSIGVPSAAATGYYRIPAVVQGVFPVASAGTYTYYLVGLALSTRFNCFWRQLTLMYFPTAYGTTSGPAAAAANDMAETDVAAERAACEARSAERMRRELDEMRAELEAVKAELQKND